MQEKHYTIFLAIGGEGTEGKGVKFFRKTQKCFGLPKCILYWCKTTLTSFGHT